jgi:hypothetical protein
MNAYLRFGKIHADLILELLSLHKTENWKTENCIKLKKNIYDDLQQDTFLASEFQNF